MCCQATLSIHTQNKEPHSSSMNQNPRRSSRRVTPKAHRVPYNSSKSSFHLYHYKIACCCEHQETRGRKSEEIRTPRFWPWWGSDIRVPSDISPAVLWIDGKYMFDTWIFEGRPIEHSRAFYMNCSIQLF